MARFLFHAFIFAAGVSLALPAQAGCHYFRVHSKALLCKEIAPIKGDEGTGAVERLLVEEEEGPTLQIRCSCDFTLRGAAQQCDFDRTDEYDFMVPAPKGSRPCQDKRRICEELCPKDLNQ